MGNVALTDAPTTADVDPLAAADAEAFTVTAAEEYGRHTVGARVHLDAMASYLIRTGTPADLAEMYLGSIVTHCVQHAVMEYVREGMPHTEDSPIR